MEWKDFTNLIGKRVKEVREFRIGGFDSGFLIFFDDGKVLNIQYGEFGDNKLEFIPIDAARNYEVYKNRVAGYLGVLLDEQLSGIQKKALKKPCPHCGTGVLHPVPNPEDTEMYLWCNNCDLSMDSSGGYTH